MRILAVSILAAACGGKAGVDQATYDKLSARLAAADQRDAEREAARKAGLLAAFDAESPDASTSCPEIGGDVPYEVVGRGLGAAGARAAISDLTSERATAYQKARELPAYQLSHHDMTPDDLRIVEGALVALEAPPAQPLDITFAITAIDEPVVDVDEKSFSGGSVDGRLLVWDAAAGKLACWQSVHVELGAREMALDGAATSNLQQTLFQRAVDQAHAQVMNRL